MKCVKNKSNNAIVRVPNKEAKKLVEQGTHNYSSKSDWKEAGRARPKNVSVEA